MDMFSALLGPVSKDDELKALADTLRKRKRAADFYSLSTIKPLQAMGQNAGQETVAAAERQGVLREALARRQAEEAQRQADRQARLEDSAADRASREEIARMLANSRENVAEMRGSKGGFAEPKTQKEREEFAKGGRMAAVFNDLVSTWKPEYAVSPADGDVPLTGDLTNWLGRKFEGMAPPEWTEKANWWQGYKENADLVRRHELFGSALTKTEQTQYEQAMIAPNDGPETIRRKLLIQQALANKVAELSAASAFRKNYDPAQIMMNYGDAVDVEGLANRIANGSYWADLMERQAESRGGAIPIPEERPSGSGSQEESEYEDGDVIENPSTGERMVWRDGEWVPE